MMFNFGKKKSNTENTITLVNTMNETRMSKEKIGFSLENTTEYYKFENLPDSILSLFYDIDEKEKDMPESEKGKKFELLLEKLFKLSGFTVERTKDYAKGVDLLVTDQQGKTYAVEAKKRHIDTANLINYKVVTALSSLISELRKKGTPIHKGIIINTHYFTNEAIETAKNEDIILIDRSKFFYMIARLCPELIAKAYFEKTTCEHGKCGVCGSPYIKAYGKYGYYLKCVSEGCGATKKLAGVK